MDATLPVDLRRFRPVVEMAFRKIQQDTDVNSPMDSETSPFASITTAGSRISPALVTGLDATGPTVTASVTVAARMEQPQQNQPQQRSLKFSVENILDPNKFTGHIPPPPPRTNNNIFHPHLHPHPHHPFFHHAAHPWILPINPTSLFHHHQHHPAHHADASMHHSTSIESEDSLYDRSDLESGKALHSSPRFFLVLAAVDLTTWIAFLERTRAIVSAAVVNCCRRNPSRITIVSLRFDIVGPVYKWVSRFFPLTLGAFSRLSEQSGVQLARTTGPRGMKCQMSRQNLQSSIKRKKKHVPESGHCLTQQMMTSYNKGNSDGRQRKRKIETLNSRISSG